jgi:2-polyprenyl-3-methyl-5-hydroxy-6-metoxy-1,4-benzoquinol methylase
LSKDGIELGNRRIDLVKPKVEFIQSTIEDYLEKTEDKFDFIMMFEVIEHVKDVDYLLELIKKVKTPEGQLLISTPSFESPLFGMDDEQNKCHIRLYTRADNTYSAVNKYGTIRTGLSMKEQLKDFEIIEMDVYSELINVRCK